MEPIYIDKSKLVPNYESDFIMKEDELILGVIRKEMTISHGGNIGTGTFYIVAAMPMTDKWQPEENNYAPLSVFFYNKIAEITSLEHQDTVPKSLLSNLFGVAEILTFQGVEVYMPTLSPEDSEFEVVINTLNGLVEFCSMNIGPPTCNLFTPGRHPEDVAIIDADACPSLGCNICAELEDWLTSYIDFSQEIENSKKGEKELLDMFRNMAVQQKSKILTTIKPNHTHSINEFTSNGLTTGMHKPYTPDSHYTRKSAHLNHTKLGGMMMGKEVSDTILGIHRNAGHKK